MGMMMRGDRPLLRAFLAVSLFVGLPVFGVAAGVAPLSTMASEWELRRLGPPSPFDPDSRTVSRDWFPVCIDSCPGVIVYYDGPGDVGEEEALQSVGKFFTDAGYFDAPPEWLCWWEDLDLQRTCTADASLGDQDFFVDVIWIGKTQAGEPAKATMLLVGIHDFG